MNKFLVATNILVATFSVSANAESIHKEVRSGSTVRVWIYRNHDSHCNDMPGIVKVVTKPAHGKISQHSALSRIGAERFGSGRCAGQMSTGLEVSYHSIPGFRGTDTFTIEADWAGNNRRETDTFTIDVQ